MANIAPDLSANLDGLQRMLNFLTFLATQKISYFLSQENKGSLSVTLTVVGQRIIVSFFPDHFEFTHYSGHEDVDLDETALMRMIQANSV